MAALYYFTGTGNSLSLAKQISDKTSARLLPIAEFRNISNVKVEDEVIGIVFPVYYGDMPVIVKEFVRKLEGISGKYIFAVCTYGGSKGNAIKNLRTLVKAQGGELRLVYAIHMPQNAFYKSSEKKDTLFYKASQMLKDINTYIENRSSGYFSSNRMLDMLSFPMNSIFEPLSRKGLQKITNCTTCNDINKLIRIAGSTFYANEKCSGCGVCARVCPVGNITMAENRPVWLEYCENCIACYNWCPQIAICGKLVQNDYYYLHPNTQMKDMFPTNIPLG
jgi:ferredoxin/flavodoxin